MKLLSIVSACYNEEGNLAELYSQIIAALKQVGDKYDYEIIIEDNCSTDASPRILRELASKDRKLKVIFNTRNFGPDRSGLNALLQARGDAVVTLASDLQNPPNLLGKFIEKWEEGFKVVLAVRSGGEESPLMYSLRSLYYRGLAAFSDIELIPHFTGFGLYDKQIVDVLRSLDDPYPYFRGLISDMGFEAAQIEFVQPARTHGKSKSNLLYLYEEAMLGITSYTKLPLRLATMLGFVAAVASGLIGAFYLIYKLIFWSEFSVGIAPLAIGLFFFGAVQLIFLGIIGEYIAAIYIQVLKRPLVYEKERINF